MTEALSSSQLGARLSQVLTALNNFPLWPLQTLARIGIGGVFYKSGMLKIQSWEITLLLFRDEYQVPFLSVDLAARLATAVEISSALLLFVGLFTRLATLPLFGVIAVIQTFVYPDAWVEHVTWSGLLLLILVRGPGPLSIDHLLARVTGISGSRAATGS